MKKMVQCSREEQISEKNYSISLFYNTHSVCLPEDRAVTHD